METQITYAISINERVKNIKEMDFKLIHLKLMDKTDGEGWTKEQCSETEKWYKRFLIICLKYPNKFIVPNKAIDKFWHRHILDTNKYSKDCEIGFGYFLHHFPYYGMGGDQDAENMKNSFLETCELMQKEFQEDLGDLSRFFKKDKDQLSSEAKCQLCYTKCRCSNPH